MTMVLPDPHAPNDANAMPTAVIQRPTTDESPEALATRLASEMAAAWAEGEGPLAEEFLAQHPELGEHPQAAIQLIYEEVCLRQERGQELRSEEIVRRFPQWQNELEALFDCHRILQTEPKAPAFPEVGEAFAGFQLVAELGRGAQGRVFLATQPSLADRPVVLKLSPCSGGEHLALARLQHTHIVPLYAMQDDPGRDLRLLCMPYFGGTALSSLLKQLEPIPLVERTGQHFLDLLDQIQATSAVALPTRGPARQLLARLSYVETICWIGACLADALQYAHERGLVHLDLKPSNILLAVDGQPMLLDFHLAREPIQPHGAPPDWLGGTPVYMSPEQEIALRAVREGVDVTVSVDGRSDLYSLGLLLYEALGGPFPVKSGAAPPLHGHNPQVSVGLADILHKCLAPNPADRYANAGALAEDLRRHLNDLPLKEVANRSVAERWQKWRRRRPHALTIVVLLGVAVAALGTAGSIAWKQIRQRQLEGEVELEAGERHLNNHEYAAAVGTLERGLQRAQESPGADELRQRFSALLQLARRAQLADELHTSAEEIRFLYSADSLSAKALRQLADNCRVVWQTRDRFLGLDAVPGGFEAEQRLRMDFLDLAIIGADLDVRIAGTGEGGRAREEALQTLAEAEQLFGPSPVLYRLRGLHAAALGRADVATEAVRRAGELTPRTAWEHYSLGRLLLHGGDLEAAAQAFDQALALQPQDFWANFYQGVCAYRQRHFLDAVNAFRVCIALSPEKAEGFYNRGLAYQALENPGRALADYDQALQRNPALAMAALNRGVLHYHQRQYGEAARDLRRALENGADPAPALYNLALVHLAQNDRPAALEAVQRALRFDPGHKQAVELRDHLRNTR